MYNMEPTLNNDAGVETASCISIANTIATGHKTLAQCKYDRIGLRLSDTKHCILVKPCS